MKRIKRSELVNLVAELFGDRAKICTITTKTKEHNMLKTDNPYGKCNVEKLSERVGIIGRWKYQNAVNNQREREGVEQFFVPEQRTWGNRDHKEPFVIHNGEVHSVEMKVEKILREQYLIDGNFATAEQEKIIKSFCRVKPESSRQKVDKEIVLRDFKLESILQIRVDGENYQVE